MNKIVKIAIVLILTLAVGAVIVLKENNRADSETKTLNNPVEKAATMDLGIIKKKYKGRLCPIGNVENKKIMVFGTPKEVEAETLECLKIGAPGGGYIISTDHSFHDDIPEENVWAYINTAKKYGKYPLKFIG